MIIAFYKPFGVLCQFTPDQPGQRTLSEFDFPKGVYPVGRLDMDSEGLLLLSDEAGFTESLLNPKNAHPRSYLVQVEGIPSAEALRMLTRGSIVVKGHRCLPCTAEAIESPSHIFPRQPPIRIRKEIPDSWIRLTLTEGKNRQVRRMTAAIGHPTLRLIREKIGSLGDISLEPGQWRLLDQAETALLVKR